MSELTPHLALPLIAASQAQKHVPVNEALGKLDALVQLSVIDRTLTSPPVSPENGDRYIVGADATDAWAGQDKNIAAYDAGWTFISPAEGWLAWDSAAQELVVFADASWAAVTAGSSGDFQNITLPGVGTEADETNPFCGKVNNALWTARETGEGGTGDLRYVLNKETSANVLSILMQSAYGGRAELGLVGDDDLLFKVSNDGSTWREAIRIDKTTGRPRFPQGGVREQLAANRIYYVRTDGSDNNSGLVNSSAGGFLTIQKAIDVIAGSLDLAGYAVTIQIEDGTYIGANELKAWTGGGTVTIQGNSETPGNVFISTTGASCFNNLSTLPGICLIKDMKLRTTTSGACVSNRGLGPIHFTNLVFDESAGPHLEANGPAAKVFATGGYSIIGGATYHMFTNAGGEISANNKAITLTGTPAWSQAFILCQLASFVQVVNNTYSGSATGKRYTATSNAVINSGGSGASSTYFPGDSNGTTATGGQQI
jgi:hypothetical protein